MADGQIRPLDAREERFVYEYLACMNGAQAAAKAGYSVKTAKHQAWKLLRRENVKAAIAEAQGKLAETAGISSVMLLLELKKIALADTKDFVTWGPRGVEFIDSEDVDGHVVAEVSETVTEAGGTKRIKLHDKLGAIDRINKMLGWYAPEKQEVSGPNGGPLQVEVSDAKQRLADRLARLATRADSGGPGRPE